MPRYVILLHEVPPDHSVTGGRGTHWDLMLEQGDTLRTWALAQEPIAERKTDAEQLPEHRLAYLDFEGPVSGNRGIVTCYESGEFDILAETPDRIDIRMQNDAGLRYLSLTRNLSRGVHFWIASFSRAPIRGESLPGSASGKSSSSS